MKVTILTLFKEAFDSYLNTSIIKRAIKAKLIEIEVVNYREYSLDKHKKVDDYQIGGGPGMVLSIEPIVKALRDKQSKKAKVILTTPSGKVFDQAKALELSKQKHIILIAGHYEGFDQRIENYVDEQISIGDYVLTGGELPCLVMLDTIARLIPGVISKDSLVSESFENNLLDYPVYTKPIEFEGYKVPEVLLSGNHKLINEFRTKQQIAITKKNRPDMYKKYKKGKDDEIK